MSLNVSAQLVYGVEVQYNEEEEEFYIKSSEGISTAWFDWHNLDYFEELYQLELITLYKPDMFLVGIKAIDIGMRDDTLHVNIELDIPKPVADFAKSNKLSIVCKLVLDVDA